MLQSGRVRRRYRRRPLKNCDISVVAAGIQRLGDGRRGRGVAADVLAHVPFLAGEPLPQMIVGGAVCRRGGACVGRTSLCCLFTRSLGYEKDSGLIWPSRTTCNDDLQGIVWVR
jgi:hypothetical protein